MSRTALALLALVSSGCLDDQLEGDEETAAVESALTSEDTVLHAARATVRVGWSPVADASAVTTTVGTVTGGWRLHNPNAGAAKLPTPLASPAAYFEMSFYAEADRPYQFWLRMRADGDGYPNDSVYAQFSDTTTSAGTAANRIGTTSGYAAVLEDCDNAGRAGWGWNDHGWCGKGASIYFETTGQHTIRIQQREDGVSIDQIVISPVTYASSAPGGVRNDTTKLAQQSASSTPPAPPPPAGGSDLKVLTWNTGGPLGATAIDLVAAQNPQVVFLQEVDAISYVENLRLKLQSTQGGTWHKHVISRGTDTSSSYVAIVSKHALSTVRSLILRQPGTYVEPCYSSSAVAFAGRAAIGATITINNRAVNLFATRMTSEGDRGCVREQEVRLFKQFASSYAGPHIYGGDFNMQPYDNEPEYQLMLGGASPTVDAWSRGVSDGTAISFDGSPSRYTPTRNTRMDYVFFDGSLTVRSAQILDEGSLSDHRMMIATFGVQ